MMYYYKTRNEAIQQAEALHFKNQEHYVVVELDRDITYAVGIRELNQSNGLVVFDTDEGYLVR